MPFDKVGCYGSSKLSVGTPSLVILLFVLGKQELWGILKYPGTLSIKVFPSEFLCG